MSTNDDALVVSDVELARRLKCSRNHLINMEKRGDMPASVRIGRLRRWSIETVNRWIAAGCPNVKELDCASV